jgi:nitrogen fixation NifU-like protein
MKHSQKEEGLKPMTEKFDKYVQELQESMLEGYSEKLKNEFLNPENLGKIDNPDSYVRVTGVCGDTIEMYLCVKSGKIINIKFLTNGCGATIACSSYITRISKGESVESAFKIKPKDIDNYFEGLPDEHKHCAKLAVITLKAALKEYAKKRL